LKESCLTVIVTYLQVTGRHSCGRHSGGSCCDRKRCSDIR